MATQNLLIRNMDLLHKKLYSKTHSQSTKARLCAICSERTSLPVNSHLKERLGDAEYEHLHNSLKVNRITNTLCLNTEKHWFHPQCLFRVQLTEGANRWNCPTCRGPAVKVAP